MRIAILLLALTAVAFARPTEDVAKDSTAAKVGEKPLVKAEEVPKEVEAPVAAKAAEPELAAKQDTVADAADTHVHEKTEGLALEIDEKAAVQKSSGESAAQTTGVAASDEAKAKDTGVKSAESEKKLEGDGETKVESARNSAQPKIEEEKVAPAQEKAIDIVETANSQSGFASDNSDVIVPKPEKKTDLPVAPEAVAAVAKIDAVAAAPEVAKSDEKLKVIPKAKVADKKKDSSEEKDDGKKESSEEKNEKTSSN